VQRTPAITPHSSRRDIDMATTIDQFTRIWKRKHDSRDNPLGQDIFPDGATLLIGIGAGASPQCHVVWHDGQGACWCLSDLTFQNGLLTGEATPRRSVDDESLRYVTLWLDEKNALQGELKIFKGGSGAWTDGPVGTFTAEADEPREEGVDAPRLEERIAV
jgi:hypothetical protein